MQELQKIKNDDVYLKTFTTLRQFIFILILGFMSCNNVSEKNTNSILVDTIPPALSVSKQNDTLLPIPPKIKQKEIYKSTLATFWERSDKVFPFDNWLSEIKDNDSILQFKFQIDSIKKIAGSTNSTKALFDLTDTWILEYYSIEGWYGFPPDQIEKRKKYFYSKQNKYELTGHDIFEIFKISEQNFPINYFPLILGRSAKFNFEWTAILPNNSNLIIRLAGSYPDGNQTSFEYEKLYLFKKFNEY